MKCPTNRNNRHYIPLLHDQTSYPEAQTRNDDDHDDYDDDNNNNNNNDNNNNDNNNTLTVE